MKMLTERVLVVFLILLFALPASAAAQAGSRFESLSTRTGVLAVHEYEEIGTFNTKYGTNIEIVLVSLQVPGEQKLYGVYMDFVTVGEETSYQTGILDADELVPLLQALDEMIALAEEARGDKSRDVSFTSRDGIRIGFSEGGGLQRAYASLMGRTSNSRTVFTLDKIGDLRDLLKRTLERLQTLGAM